MNFAKKIDVDLIKNRLAKTIFEYDKHTNISKVKIEALQKAFELSTNRTVCAFKDH